MIFKTFLAFLGVIFRNHLPIFLALSKARSLGQKSISRKTLIAVVLYSMNIGYFSAQEIINFAADSIGVHWILGGMKMPSYKINA